MITTVTLNASLDKLYVIDELRPESVMRVKQVIDTAGGKGLNVSKAIALLGEPVYATGFMGGHIGSYIRYLLRDTGIEDGFISTNANTRTCINIRDQNTQKHTELLEPGGDITPSELDAFIKAYSAALEKSSVVTLSGSVPGSIPPDIYAKLVRMAKQAGAMVVLDTSGQALKEALKENPTLVKPNRDEIAQIMGRTPSSKQELIDAAMQLHKDGIAYVAVSLGKDGSLLVCNQAVFTCNALTDLPAVNTVGCGDCMVAGFAVGLRRGYSPEKLLRFASAVANANAMTMQTGSFDPAVVPRLEQQIKVEKLN